MLSKSNLEVLFAIKKFFIRPENAENKATAFDRWLTDFFLEHAKINIKSGFFEPRLDVGLAENSEKVYTDTLLIYGVDFLDTLSMLNKYYKFQINVERIDESHCILKFQNSECLKNFLINQIRDEDSPVKD